MGSISGVPSYPSISGYTQSTIDSEVTSTKSTYDTRKSEYNTALTNYINSVSATEQAVINYKNTGYTTTTVTTYRDNAYNNYIAVQNNPASTPQQKTAAYNAYQSAQNTYNDVYNKYNTANNLLYEQSLKQNALNTALDNLQSAATSYTTALARKQMFADQQAANNIGSTFSSLSDDISDPQFAGLTADQYNQLVSNLNSLNADPRTNLINAYDAYRYLEWQIASARVTALKAGYNETYYWLNYQLHFDQSYTLDLFTSAQTAHTNAKNAVGTLTNQRSSISSSLDTAINTYKNAYKAVQDPLLTAINSARDQAANWGSYVAGLQQAAQAHIDQMYSTDASQDLTTRQQHASTYVDQNDPIVEQALTTAQGIYTSNITRITTSGTGVSNDVSTPSLPSSKSSMSISQLMWIISQVQLMLDQLSRQMSMSDYKINAFRRAIGENNADDYVRSRVASDIWNVSLYDADTAYNAQVLKDNLSEYNQAREIYLAYQQRVSIINTVIKEVNAEIDVQNQRAKNLVDAANSINGEITNAINATAKNKAETTNVMDYTGADADTPTPADETKPDDITYPENIPHFPLINSIPAPPPFIDIPAEGELPQFPTADQIASMNQAIKDLAAAIAPFKERVQKALSIDISGSQDGYGVLELQPYYERATIPVRNTTLKTEFDGYLSFLVSYSTQISAMRAAATLSEEEQNRFMASAMQRIEEILGSPLITTSDEAKDASQSIGAGIGLTLADPKIKSSRVATLINQISQSANFTNAVGRVFEVAAIIAGLRAAGITPDAMKNLSTMGIPLSELLQESGIDLTAAIQSESNSALAAALIEQLSISAKNVDSLQKTALDILSQSPAIKSMSPEEIKEAIASLVALIQMLLLLLASLLGSTEGISPIELMASFGQTPSAESDLKNALQALGIPEAKAQALVSSLGESIMPLLALFSDMKISPESQLALLLLIGANRGGISLTDGVPGGKAFIQTLLEALKKDGIAIPQGAINTQSEVGKAILSKDFLKQLVVQLEVKASNLQRDIIKQEILRSETRRQEAPRREESANVDKSPEQQLRDSVRNTINTMATSFEESARNPLTGLLPLSVSDRLGLTQDRQSPLSPQAILGTIRQNFERLPIETRKAVLDSVKGKMDDISLSEGDKAALVAALVRKDITSQEASALLALLMQDQAAQLGTKYSALATELVQKIFQPTQEDLRIKEEIEKKKPQTEDMRQRIERPSTLPKQTREIMREAFEVVSRSFVDQKFAAKSIESFARIVSKMTDFNEIAVNFLMDPAKVFLREFSIITRSSLDKSKQPPVFLEG